MTVRTNEEWYKECLYRCCCACEVVESPDFLEEVGGVGIVVDCAA